MARIKILNKKNVNSLIKKIPYQRMPRKIKMVRIYK